RDANPARAGPLPGSHAGGAVDSLAEQVGVAVVPGVLLDHVHVDPADAHVGLAAGVVEDLVEVMAGGGLPGGLHLGQVHREISLGVGVVDVVELAVGVGLTREQEGDVLAVDPAAEPAALHLGHVPHQAEQGEPGRRGRALAELVRRQAGALGEQRLAVEVQPRLEHRALARDGRDGLAVGLRCGPWHAASLVWRGGRWQLISRCRAGGGHARGGGNSRATVSASGTPSKNRASTARKTFGAASRASSWPDSASPASAAANSVIDERSFMASTGPKTCWAERPAVPATIWAHSRSRGPSTGWAR